MAEQRRRAIRRLCSQSLRVTAALVGLLFLHQPSRGKQVTQKPALHRSVVTPQALDRIWVVETTTERLLYSNGLIVRRDHETESVPRRYRVYDSETLRRNPEPGSAPAGIVFHTTESQILPLEADRNSALLRSRADVLEHARRGRLYNFVIDRFGQVSRIVPEQQTALHAGHSVWASGKSVWVDLNESFIGISFEAETAEPFTPSAAQTHSGRLLTAMLRSQYGIPDENCVTHAQVSVNPDNMRAGYHTDWGSAFPFEAVGLKGGYQLPLAAVALFGFGHDQTFLNAMGGSPWPGLLAADNLVAQQAEREDISTNKLLTRLQHRYKTFRRKTQETTP